MPKESKQNSSENDDDDDDDDDLFGDSDSDDTAELLAASGSQPSGSSGTTGRLRKGPAPSRKKSPAVEKATSRKEDSDDGGGGLFDSSDEESDKEEDAKVSMTKKERLQALAAKKRGTSEPSARASVSATPSGTKGSGYDSEDSDDSGNYERTAEDDAFIDTTGEDADALQELYAEQHFDDDRAHKMTKKQRGQKRSHQGDDDDHRLNSDKIPDNPIMAAVHKMKKKQRSKKLPSELEEECKIFLGRMEQAAADDEECIAKRTPATHKLKMLQEVTAMLARRDTQRMLLDLDLLVLVKRWIQPLPNGGLGNVTVRQRLLEAIATMTGDNGITSNDLKSSEIGKTVMILYKHKDETPSLKNGILRKLIEQWSRPIFQKSANHRDLERVGSRGDRGLSALAKQQQYMAKLQQSSALAGAASADSKHQNLQALIKGGAAKGGVSASAARVSVPFSKGFQYTVRPAAKAATPEKGARVSMQGKDTRDKLTKKMQEKTRTVSKNNRSASVSIEGRAVK